MSAFRILVVEDEQDIADLIRHTLVRDGHHDVVVVHTGDAALQAAYASPFDLIVLDVNLPTVGGFEVCRLLRRRPETSRTPIIMLTARASEVDRVTGLDLGADDYITKPFSLKEFAARVRAALRRREPPGTEPRPDGDVFHGAHIVADFDAITVTVDGEPVRLTRREFELLRCLIQNRNRVLSRDRLLERVWGFSRHVETRSVDVHVGRLRNKLGPAGIQIETMVGLGYRFVE